MTRDKEICCDQSRVIARTKFRTDVCGEGSWGILLECPRCDAIYLKSLVVSEARLPCEQEKYWEGDSKYCGEMNRTDLIRAVENMTGGIQSLG